jgi:penicillin-binding protein 1A
MELLQAYSTFANRGTRIDLTTVRAVVDSKGVGLARHMPSEEKVFDEDLVDRLNALLKNVVLNGTAKSMSAHGYTKAAYGKTGTTSFYRDAWFAGFSQGLTAVTWLGFDELKVPVSEEDPESKNFKSPANLTGAGAALPIWARFFKLAVPAAQETTFLQ